MAVDDRIFSRSEFLASNPNKRLGGTDYLHAVFKLYGLPLDIVFCLAEMFNPEFKVVDGLVFLEEQFERAEYEKQISENINKHEAQMWLNLIEITGIFENIDTTSAVKLANALANVWNFKLEYEAHDGVGRARVICDTIRGEVFVTIDSVS